MLSRSLLLIAALLHLAPASLDAQCSSGEVSVLASRDNTLYEDNMGSLSNADGAYMFAGMSSAADGPLIRRAVLHFDVASAIPIGSTITSARLRLSSDSTPIGTHDVSLHKILSDWGDGTSDAGNPGNVGTAATINDPTWLHTFYDTGLWTTPGGDFAPVASATLSIGTSGAHWWGSNAAMTADVEGWFNDPSTNNGWIAIGDETTADSAKRFNKRSNGPTLCVGVDVSGFQVNTYTTSNQRRPDIAQHDDGFIAVWSTDDFVGTDTSPSSIRGQRLDSSGALVGSEFQVNTYTPLQQQNPAVAAWPDGRFAVVWFSSNIEIQGQLFNSDGTPNGGELTVEAASSLTPTTDIAVNADSFVVVWSGTPGPSDSGNLGIVGRIFSSDGSSLGADFQINTYTTGYQFDPTIETAPDSSFVVAWVHQNYDSGDGIRGQRLFSDGTLSGSEFIVNSYTGAEYFYGPRLDFDAEGGFVVAWTDYNGSPGTDTLDKAVVARRFDSFAMPLGADFQVNTYTVDYQETTDVFFEPGNGFIVVWDNQIDDGQNVTGSRYDSTGARVGLDFRISHLADGFQGAALPDAQGNFLVVWESDTSAGTDTSGFGIQGRFILSEADVGVSKSNNVSEVAAGGQTTYEVIVTNHGPDTATNVLVNDTLPSELGCLWSAMATGGASGWSSNGVDDIAETLLMPAGSSVTYEMVCDIDPGASGTLANTATVSADQVDENAANDSATDEDTVTRSADLGVALDDFATSPGAAETITATVTNGGPADSLDTTVTVTLPSALGFTSSADCTEMDGTVTCMLSGLLDGEQGTVSFDVLVDTSLTNDEMIMIHAAVSGSKNDPNPANDTASGTLTVMTLTDVAVTKTDDVDMAAPGGQVTYTITAINNGPHVAAAVGLTDTLPGELTCSWTSVAAGGAGGQTAAGSGGLTETLLLPPSATVTYTLTCDIDPAATGTLSNTANITHVTDTNAANNTATDTDNLVPATDLSLALPVAGTDAIPSTTRSFTAAVTNNGPSSSTGMTVSSILPPGLTFSSSEDCSEDAGTVTCAIGALAPSAQAAASFDVLVDAGQSDGTMITLSATVMGNEADAVTGNDSDSVTLTVITPIFNDSFETGDTSNWSFAVP